MAVPIVWELMADLDGDGTFEADFTPYIRGGLNYGIGREDALAAFGARTLSVALANQDSRFSPKNTAGPYGTTLRRGKKVRLRASPGVTFANTTNLIENPSLESSFVGWTAVGAATRALDTAQAYYGKQSLKVTTTNAAAVGVVIRKNDGTRFAVTAGQNYFFHVRLRAPVGKNIEWRIRWFNAALALISEDLSSEVALPDWFAFNGRDGIGFAYQAPAGAVTAELYVVTALAEGVYDFHLDGAMFYNGSNLRPYVDGDQPQCTWAGAAHASQSTRLLASQQTIPQFIGRITDFGVSRDPNLMGTMVLECASDDDAWYHKVISCGVYLRKKAKDIAQAFTDLLEEGELILDGAMRSTPTGGVPSSAFGPPEGETFVAIGGFQMLHVPMTGMVYARIFEGDNAMARTLSGDVIGDGWYVDKTSATSNSVSYTATLFAFTPAFNDGKRWTFELWDNITGVVATSTVTMVAGAWVYATVTGSFTAASTDRRIRWIALDTPTNEADGLIIDGLHMVPTANRIARTVTGLDYDIEVFPQTGFHRSASALLEEFAKSATAWVYEDASGGLVFEQADTSRVNTAVPKLRLTDHFDGIGYEVGPYQEGWNNIYNRIRVGSYGNFTDLNLIRRPFNLEPAGLVLGANETKVLYADYATEETGPIIGRIANAKVVLSAGAMVANYPILRGFGASAEIVVKATAAGATITECYVEARPIVRNTSERSFVEVSGSSPITEPKVLELECPGQGYRNSRMSTLAAWAATKYGPGPAKISPTIVARNVSASDAGIEGWQYVMEIIGRDLGTPVWVKHKSGQAEYDLDELYYVEGRTVSQGAQNEMPRVELQLEAA